MMWVMLGAPVKSGENHAGDNRQGDSHADAL
jgi:hypothetical protein